MQKGIHKKYLSALLLAAIILTSAGLPGCGNAEIGEEVTETTEAVETEPVYDGTTYTREEKLAMIDDAVLKLPGSFYDPEIKAEYFEKLNAIRDEYIYPDTISDEVFWEFEQVKKKMVCSYRSDYPVIVLNVPENLDKNKYRDATITVIDGDELIEAPITAKVRGNSTAGAPKKPYNIRFSEKISLFGMEEGKKWSLLANMFDKTMLRNKLALDLGGKMNLDYVSQTEFCEIWVNGKYVGNYLCCEPVSDGANRVGVDTNAFDFILEITPFGGWSFKSGAGVEIFYDSPENPTDEQKKHLNKLLDLAETAMKSGDSKEYSKYIDVDSFIDLFILKELFKDVDGYWKSLYFYVKDDILYAGPPWDFDLTCGNVSLKHKEENYDNYFNKNGHGDKSNDSTHGLRMVHGWWKILREDEEFCARMQARYEELQPMIVNIYADNELGKNQIDLLLEANLESFEREYKQYDTDYNAGWDVYFNYSQYAGESKGDITANVEYLRTWLEQRNAWLLENIGK